MKILHILTQMPHAALKLNLLCKFSFKESVILVSFWLGANLRAGMMYTNVVVVLLAASWSPQRIILFAYFDLAQFLCWMPFLTQPSHLTRH